ncbi:MAG: DNA repair protein RadC [Bacteroidales bacterium]|nr:DNA repair protein RadC [Bacteroidales bacterium]
MNEKKSLTLKEWADEDKPREKMLSHGKKTLTNAELIAILLRSGLKGKSVVEVAKEVLARTGNSLTSLSQMEFNQLSPIKGVGPAKATTLMAALELGWRMHSEIGDSNELIINDSTAMFRYMAPVLADLDHEEFWAVYVSNRCKVLGRQRISVGGLTGTPVDLRILFRGAIECKAVSVMVAHNHPSGLLRPSREDREVTGRILEGGKTLDIKLLEHIIIAIGPSGKADYFSFKDEGLL